MLTVVHCFRSISCLSKSSTAYSQKGTLKQSCTSFDDQTALFQQAAQMMNSLTNLTQCQFWWLQAITQFMLRLLQVYKKYLRVYTRLLQVYQISQSQCSSEVSTTSLTKDYQRKIESKYFIKRKARVQTTSSVMKNLQEITRRKIYSGSNVL